MAELHNDVVLLICEPHPMQSAAGPAPLTADAVRDYLRIFGGVQISIEEAVELVPLVLAQKAAFAALEQFEVGHVRPSATFDPREPYAR